jgi:hypothetical protein
MFDHLLEDALELLYEALYQKKEKGKKIEVLPLQTRNKKANRELRIFKFLPACSLFFLR